MARTFTVSELITLIRERSNTERSNFVSDTEIIRLIDQAYTKLYDLIVSKFENYYIDEHSFTTDGTNQFYDLPANFYKLVGLDQLQNTSGSGDNALTVRPFNFNERNRYNNILFAVTAAAFYRYLIQGTKIKILPQPSAGIQFKMWFIPAPVKITSEAQTIDGISGWEEVVTLTAAIQIMNKQELDATALKREQAEAIDRVMTMATERDAALPERVTDLSVVNEQLALFPVIL
jgi:hypothetical protein